MQHNVIIYGEMLWDCLPSGPVPGGAPMNVTLNLHQLGLNARLISAIGNDERGEQLLDFLRTFKLPLNLIQIDRQHDTSTVLVNDADPENIKYRIVSPVAWDFIQWNDEMDAAVASSDAFVFGTLGVRNVESLTTLLKLLQHKTLRIFDVNFRPPFYDFESIETLLGFADILKMNEDELEVFAHHYKLDTDVISVCSYLEKKYSLHLICITKGSKGAVIYRDGNIISHEGYKITVADSIGAGDAFLSGFIKTYLDGKPLDQVLDFACKLGAFVASKKGGTPKYKSADL